MKIGYDVASTCHEKTGCTWYADSLIRSMVRGHPEHVFFLYHHFGKNCSDNAAGGTVIDATNASHPLRKFTAQEGLGLWRGVEAGAKPPGDPDIVQANFFDCPLVRTAPVAYVVYDLAFLICPEFLTGGHYFSCLPGLCDALGRASGFIFISEHTRQEFEHVFPGWLQRHGVPNRVILLASRGSGSNSSASAGSVFWLSVGTIEPRKNHDVLLAAHDLYWERSAHKRPLMLAGGRGWLSGGIHEAIARRENEGRARYAGYVNEDELNRLYADAFAFIYPSHYEGFGLPVLEAMERGVPVISSSATSLPEVGGDTVEYFDPRSPEQLAEKMLALEQDDAHRHRLAVAGKQRAAQFSWRRVADETIDFYGEVIARWKRNR